MAQGTQRKYAAMGRGTGDQRQTANELMHYLRQFAEENPTSAALWCFGIGFVLGWKMKPW
jgi:hypothetical protein